MLISNHLAELRKHIYLYVTKYDQLVFLGLGSIRFLGPKIWKSLPNNSKNKESIESFKMAIKKWKPESSPCRLYKTFQTEHRIPIARKQSKLDTN